jgi:hypothetical protein
MEVKWIAFPLHPETPEEALTLEELIDSSHPETGNPVGGEVSNIEIRNKLE